RCTVRGSSPPISLPRPSRGDTGILSYQSGCMRARLYGQCKLPHSGIHPFRFAFGLEREAKEPYWRTGSIATVTRLLLNCFPSGAATWTSNGTASPKIVESGTRTWMVYTPASPGTAVIDSTLASTPARFTDTIPVETSAGEPKPVPQIRISSPGCVG